ncbi:MAG TPA: methyl-accepting chemotaxis protein [Bryobacteraceae bacterium]|nr:methyl-accepting chemotaxis protein [Bryobacteraceae bacterium]
MRTWTIGTKLMGAFGAMLALALGLSYSALHSLGNMKADFDDTVTRTARSRYVSALTVKDSEEMRSLERGIMVRLYMKDLATVEKYKQEFRDTDADLSKDLTELRNLARSEQARNLIANTERLSKELMPLHEEVMRALAVNLEQGVAVYTAKAVPKFKELEQAAQAIGDYETARLSEAVTRSEENASRSRWIAFLLLGISVTIGAAIVWVVRSITVQLRSLANEMNLGSEQVSSAAGQVSSSSQSLAQGASEQAASLEETSASSEEITSMTRKNAENSRSAASLTTKASELVTTANHDLEQMVSSMQEINASSDKIAKIIKVIDEIAFQTNILALNAAVEAARAGDAGMGFAVVADEVRNLAQRSAQAAKDTAALIEESIAKSNDGKSKLDQVAKAIHDITANVTQINTLVDEVKLGSEEQARGIEQIAKAIAQMEQVTQKTAANAEESASASEELNAQAASMDTIVGQLRGMVGGAETAPVGHAKPARQGQTRSAVVHKAAPAARGTQSASPARQTAVAIAEEVTSNDDFKEF